MQPHKVHFTFVFLFLIVCKCFSQSNIQPGDKTVAHLRKFKSDYLRAVKEKKADILSGYYDDNVRLMPEFQKTVFGKANALTYHQSFATRLDVLEFSRTEIDAINIGQRVIEPARPL